MSGFDYSIKTRLFDVEFEGLMQGGGYYTSIRKQKGNEKTSNPKNGSEKRLKQSHNTSTDLEKNIIKTQIILSDSNCLKKKNKREVTDMTIQIDTDFVVIIKRSSEIITSNE